MKADWNIDHVATNRLLGFGNTLFFFLSWKTLYHPIKFLKMCTQLRQNKYPERSLKQKIERTLLFTFMFLFNFICTLSKMWIIYTVCTFNYITVLSATLYIYSQRQQFLGWRLCLLYNVLNTGFVGVFVRFLCWFVWICWSVVLYMLYIDVCLHSFCCWIHIIVIFSRIGG